MDFAFTDEQETFLGSFRNFCKREIFPFAEEVDNTGIIPQTHYEKLAQIGYTGLVHPRSYGGQEAGHFLSTLAQMILAEHCGSTFFSVGASTGLFGMPLISYGTPAQKDQFVRPIIQGKKIGCLAVTEPGAGSDVSAIQTKAKKIGNEYIITGQKTFITNAPVFDFALVLCKLDDGGSSNPTFFIVPRDLDGVSIGKPMRKMGLKGSPTGEIFLSDVKLNQDHLLGRPGLGFRITMETFKKERLAMSAYAVGVMAACLNDSLRYSKERKSFGRPISKHQSVAFMLADIKTRYEAAYWLLMETAWLAEEAEKNGLKDKIEHNGMTVDLNARASEIKLLSSTYAREVCNLAVQIHGGAGYMDEFRVSRLYRDIKIAEIGGGTSEIQKQIVAHSEAKRVRV